MMKINQSWNLETYIYKSQSENWMYECFACIGNIVIYTLYKCESWKDVLTNCENQSQLNCLGCDQLDSWLRLSEEGQIFEKLDPTLAIDHWFNDKVRLLTSSSH